MKTSINLQRLAYAIAIAIIPATAAVAQEAPGAITSGNDRIKLGISGQINRALLSYDDGEDTGTLHVDNDNSSSRVRFTGETVGDEAATFGVNIELQFESNSTASVNQNEQRNVGPNSFTERKLEAFAEFQGIGRITIGQGDTASNGSAETDLSGTTVVGYSGVDLLAGGLLFRDQISGDLLDINIVSAFSNLDGLSRDDRLRYDTPSFGGAVVSVSLIADERWDTALRYQGQFGSVKTSFALAYADAHAENDGELEERFDGSISALHDNGLSVTVAAGQDDRTDRDPEFGYIKFGYQATLTSFGMSAFAIDFYDAEDISSAGAESSSVGFMFVQSLDKYATELYAGIRNYELDLPASTGSNPDDVLAGLFGARVKF